MTDPDAPILELTIQLDRPFHELKQLLLDEFERTYLRRCLEESVLNVSRASRISGLSRKHVRTLMAKHGLRAQRELAVAVAAAPEPQT
jgi:DNA-binding NtrC family response regulator